LGGRTFAVGFLYLPLALLIALVVYALVAYERGVMTDVQSYFSTTDNVRGKVLIHLLPIGVAWHTFRSARFGALMLVVFASSLAYSLLFTERLYVLQVAVAAYVGLQCSGAIKMGIRTAVVLAVAALAVFVMSELSRSYISSKIRSEEFSVIDGALYGLKRFFLYYADPSYKSAEYVSRVVAEGSGASGRYDWEILALTNRGGLWYLVDDFGLLLAIVLSLLLMIMAGAILRMAKAKIVYAVVLAPTFFMAVFEFVMVDYYAFSRFWVPIIAIFIYSIVVACLGRGSPKQSDGRRQGVGPI
jgi:hypothetical protein